MPGCGKDADGSKTHYECLRTGIAVGSRNMREKMEKKIKKVKQEYEIKGIQKGKKTKKVYTREELNKMKKGGLEDIGKRIFGLTNMRKTRKDDIIQLILSVQKVL